MPASSVTHQVAAETIASPQPNTSPRAITLPSRDHANKPKTRQLPAQLKAHNPNGPAPIQSGDGEQNDPAGATALGPGEDTVEYSQEGSRPSNPTYNGQDDPAGDTVKILGDDTGGAKSDVTGFMQISNLAATASTKSLQYAADTNSDGSRFPAYPSVLTTTKSSEQLMLAIHLFMKALTALYLEF